MTEAANIIRRELGGNGVLRFDRFMELALYCPDFGYYERPESAPGRRGDYFTSVSVGPLFGHLLAARFAHWLEAWQFAAPCVLESGAHDGTLARDILDWMHHHHPALAGRMRYIIVEPSARRRAWQQATLSKHDPPAPPSSGPQAATTDEGGGTPDAAVETAPYDPWHWILHEAAPAARLRRNATEILWLENLPRRASVTGVIFSNELLDAFPVRRLGWDAAGGRWYEFGVTLEGERLSWTRMPLPPAEARDLLLQSEFWIPPALERVLPDGFTLELSPQAIQWWRTAATALDSGWLLTLDYGVTSDELLTPGRAQGTLRAYRRHQVCGDVLADPGEQDLTAHVNFTALQKAGRAEGLYTEGWLTQERFLTDVAAGPWREDHGTARVMNPEQLRQFQTLTHPQHLGQRFSVLLQTRLPA